VFWEESHEFGGDSVGCGAGWPDLRRKREKIVEERRGRGGGGTMPFTRARPRRSFSSPHMPGSGETHGVGLARPVLEVGAFWSFYVG
jgi:hypothetical protein